MADQNKPGRKLPKRTGKRGRPGPFGRAPKRDRNRANTSARKAARMEAQKAREAANRLLLESAPAEIRGGTRTARNKWLAQR